MRGSFELEEAEINLTPLIDVVFVILIMFIVVAPLLNLDKVELAQGANKRYESATNQSPITLHVYEDNSLSLNLTPITFENLSKVLPLLKERFPQATPELFHDKKGSFGTYQKIKGALEEAGFSNLDIVLKP